jgi:hypothetical protein
MSQFLDVFKVLESTKFCQISIFLNSAKQNLDLPRPAVNGKQRHKAIVKETGQSTRATITFLELLHFSCESDVFIPGIWSSAGFALTPPACRN